MDEDSLSQGKYPFGDKLKNQSNSKFVKSATLVWSIYIFKKVGV